MPPTARALIGQERLTAAQRSRLKEVFDAADADGSEELDYPELKAALSSSGVKLSLKELKQLWIKADKDASSGIDFDEFCNAIEGMPASLPSRQESMKALQAQLHDAEQETSGCLVM